jgi:hypothetical protein
LTLRDIDMVGRRAPLLPAFKIATWTAGDDSKQILFGARDEVEGDPQLSRIGAWKRG